MQERIEKLMAFLTAESARLPIAAACVLLLLLIAVFAARRKKRDRFDPHGVYRRRRLFSAYERQQQYLLAEYARELGLELYAKVRLIDIVEPMDGRDYQMVNRVIRKHCDFVLLRPDGETLAVVELDDASHDRDDARHRDMVKDRALADAGIPIFRCRAVTDELYESLYRLSRKRAGMPG